MSSSFFLIDRYFLFLPEVSIVKPYKFTSEMLETMHENDLFNMFPEFSKVVHILAVICATLCSAERSFSVLCQLKTYLCSTMGQQCVNNISLINIERAYAKLCSQQ